ncbi:hypothetical protein VTK73DRAFT_4110 [Phialemonium thermophilum]|uniref:Rhodanese domain-containing protein n=1 Tax=Phialemonium thermophilum TaxID=223376 RepID=A0ABR3VBS2_9PEZI
MRLLLVTHSPTHPTHTQTDTYTYAYTHTKGPVLDIAPFLNKTLQTHRAELDYPTPYPTKTDPPHHSPNSPTAQILFSRIATPVKTKMSPIATSPSTTVLETSRGGGHPTNGGHGGFSFGASGSGAPGRPGKRTLPHISDVTSVTVDLDPYTPIDKVLGSAESLLRQAESSRSFGRPDLALSDYIRASIIVVDLIKRNKGWASLQSDNKVQLDRYRHIVRQVDSLHEAYEKVKADIKADNARTGVQPVSRTRDSRDARATANGHGVDNAMHANERGQAGAGPRVDSSAGGGATTTTAKTKPAIHPKPQALHGNAIRSSASNGVAGAPKAAEDLAQRFAKLRQASAPRVQDPRIRTQPIVPPSSGDGPGHAAAPSSFPPSSFPPDTAAIARGVLPELPKVPDAIYSPARGSVSSTTGELPSSTPRGMYSRPGSVAPVPSSSHAAKSPAGEDYFGSYASATPTSSTTPVHRRSINVPPGDTLTVAELVELMRQGAKDLSILLIDIRSRAEFDDGHIMSQATICVESEVLMRENISANDIADSMVLAPTSEQLNFERRHSFDVIVFYDQDSTHISPYPNTPQQRAISGLRPSCCREDWTPGPA